MKVADIMEKSLVTVTEETPIKEIGRIIFSLGISGVPVVDGKKLVGIITEKDLLSKMFPSLADLSEDYIHTSDFSAMEENLKSLLQEPVSKIVNKKVKAITPDTELMAAQSIMLLNKFSRIPVVDSENNLIGIISQGDIFRHLIRDEIPQLEKEKYADFIGRYYDQMVNWGSRFSHEFPTIISLLKKEKVNRLIDVGVWTGEYTIGLAKETRFNILGLDHNEAMIKLSNKKRENLSTEIKKRLSFRLTDFKNIDQEINDKYDGAICMGGSLPYIPVEPEILFTKLSKVLDDKKGIIVLQVLNFRKIFKSKGRLLNFRIQHTDHDQIKEHLFIEFFENINGDCLYHHVVVFDFDGVNWIYKGLTTIEICERTKDELEKALMASGFGNISFSGNMGEYQGEYGELLLDKPFDIEEDDWLNIVAKRK